MAKNDRAIREQFMRVLGRDARPDEIEFFNGFLAENDLTPFDVGEIIAGHPEAQQTRLNQQTDQYGQMLGKYDDQILGQAQKTLQGQFARMGRPSSTGYTAAFSNAARDVAMARQGQLAQFYGGGLQGLQNQYMAAGSSQVPRALGLRDERRQRGWAIDDYYRAQNDYNSAMRGQSTRNLQGSLLNAGINLAARGAAALGTKGMSEFGQAGAQQSGAGLGPYNPGGGFNYGYKQPGVQDFYNIPYARY